ncbi:MAG: aminoglycoside phosphotransferase [Thermodesulfatator sp.]|nr:MAG: aminoglycoside phosphotransferase [Thermodesulfatator sp.]
MENKPQWLDAMLDPSFYPGGPDDVKLIQTHLSWVFLAGQLVYKIKKPVNFGFLDFTTLEKRHFFCNEEIRLNKRLCPEIYKGTVPINKQEDGGFCLGGPGETVEWAVEMKRMPDDGLMSVLIERDEVTETDILGIERLLVPFYEKAVAPRDKVYLGGIDTVRENCEENFEQIREFVGRALSEQVNNQIISYTRDFMATNESLFVKRQEEGRIVEGHGDLYSANICFDRQRDRIYIFDCIEFNERFRYGDVAVDIAFLAMDLDFLGLCDLDHLFTQEFREDTKDDQIHLLLDFYKCYRAVVRGKIGCFTWASPGVDQATKEKSLEHAKRYFQLAYRYAGGITQRPTLFVFMGLSGTGKSTVATAFGAQKGLSVYNSDFVRKEIISGIKATESRKEPFGQGIYSKDSTDRTYRALARLAGKKLVVGESVVLDATYIDPDKRRHLKKVADASGARLVFIVCFCPEEVVKKRLAKRDREAKKVSDGRLEIYEKQKEIYEEPRESEADSIIRLDTNGPVDELVSRLKDLI